MSIKALEEARALPEMEGDTISIQTAVPSLHPEEARQSEKASETQSLSSSNEGTLQVSDSDNHSHAETVKSALQDGVGEKLRRLGRCTVEITHKLPPAPEEIKGKYRKVRHFFFNVYRRLFLTVLMANIVGFIILLFQPSELRRDIRIVSSAASANLTIAILARQDYIINAMFELLVLLPKRTPLRIRRLACKVYEFGGMHSGCAFSSTLWFIRLTVLLTKDFADKSLRHVPLLGLAYALLLLFVSIIIFAYPRLRIKVHDTFERTHRFAGWIANALFWTLIILAAQAIANRPDSNMSTSKVLFTLPSFYLLTVNTLHTFLPWLRLRKLPATGIRLSDHALRLHLNANVGHFYTIRLSTNPIVEWHSFACFPDLPAQSINNSTNSCVISRAGDWTSSTIEHPKDHYWTRGLPTRGVLYMSLIFRRLVVVTTGSGIGPCLNLLAMHPDTRPACRVLWSASRPVHTFGQEICDTVLESDPNSIIWDTKKSGRPDLVAIAWHLAMESNAEAVFCISNNRVTKEVVYALESRGMPAFGPIFDS